MAINLTSEDVASVINIAIGQLRRRGVKLEVIRDALLFSGANIAVKDSKWTHDVVARYVDDYAKTIK